MGWSQGAHPRSRGENESKFMLVLPVHGSSPLTRGKQTEVALEVLAGRLIPAHAGKTVQPATSEQIDAAHPRSRGENLEDHWEVLEADGSSPLTRGKLTPVYDAARLLGLIPAHAGKTSSVVTF